MKIFGKKEPKKQEEVLGIDWYALKDIEQIKEIEQESTTQLIGIFKHSTRCGISSEIFRRFNKSFSKEVKMYYLDILSYREVSNQVSCTFNVVHQSPQLLLIKNKEVVQHASHYDILQVIPIQKLNV